jgi:hypothetical protein
VCPSYSSFNGALCESKVRVEPELPRLHGTDFGGLSVVSLLGLLRDHFPCCGVLQGLQLTHLHIKTIKGRAANNCTTCFSGFKHKCDVISITITFASQASSDLSLGGRLTSKSDELLCDANVYVIGIVIERFMSGLSLSLKIRTLL